VLLNLLKQKGEIDNYDGMDLSSERLRKMSRIQLEEYLKDKQYQRLPDIPLDTPLNINKRHPATPKPILSSMSSQNDEDDLFNNADNTLNDYLTRSKLGLEDAMFKLNKQYFGIRNFNDPLSMIQESDYDSLPERISSNLRNSAVVTSVATKNNKIKELLIKIIKLLFKKLVRRLTMFIIIFISCY
jgi:hypothetical protein